MFVTRPNKSSHWSVATEQFTRLHPLWRIRFSGKVNGVFGILMQRHLLNIRFKLNIAAANIYQTELNCAKLQSAVLVLDSCRRYGGDV